MRNICTFGEKRREWGGVGAPGVRESLGPFFSQGSENFGLAKPSLPFQNSKKNKNSNERGTEISFMTDSRGLRIKQVCVVLFRTTQCRTALFGTARYYVD